MSKYRSFKRSSNKIFNSFYKCNYTIAHKGFLTRFFNVSRQVEKEENTDNSTISRIWKTNRKAAKVSYDIEKYLFNSKVNNHIDLSSSEISSKNGKLFIREEAKNPNEKPSLRVATEEEVKTSTTIAVGGIQGDEDRQVSALLKTAKILAAKSNAPETYLPVAVYPEVGRKERYEAAVKYTLNTEYVPSYIERRVEKYLLPKVIDNLDSDCGRNNISLFSFSMGGREIMMMETALRNILQNKMFLPKVVVDNLMSDVRAVCIGYAPSLTAFDKSGFNKIVIFSVDDRGVLIPRDLYDILLTKEGDLVNNHCIKQLHTDIKSFKYLIIDGKNTIDANDKDYVDHTISHYVDIIDTMPSDVVQTIGACISCADEILVDNIC